MSEFKIEREQFELSGIHILPKTKACKLSFTISKKSNEGFEIYDCKVVSNVMAHHDILNTINQLREPLCKINKIEKNNYSRILPTGIMMYGEGEKAAFKIHGSLLTDSNKYNKLTPEKVFYNDKLYEFTAYVLDIIDFLEDEAYKYLFEDKKAILTLGLGSEDREDDQEDFEESEDVTEDED